MRALPTLSPKPTNLPNRLAVLEGKPGMCAYKRESPVGKYTGSQKKKSRSADVSVVWPVSTDRGVWPSRDPVER